MVPEPKSDPVPKHVLFIEDEILIRSIVAEVLRHAGLIVIEADNADEAWSYLRAGAPADLILSDIQLPGSMDGVELARSVEENYDHVVVVLTSTWQIPPTVKHDHFIRKPYSPANLVAILKSLLEQN